MTLSSIKRALTTPPPPRSPPPKYPFFTRDVFSTKSFGPGHVVGAAMLVFGLVGIAKLFIGLGEEEAERMRARSSQPIPPRPEDEPRLSQTGDTRGNRRERP